MKRRDNYRRGGGGPTRTAWTGGLLLILTTTAHAADLYGRVFDTLRGSMYPGAVVTLTPAIGGELRAVTDNAAQFRLSDVTPGVYQVRVEAESRQVVGRLRVATRPQTQITHLDLGKIDPPDENDEY